MSATLAFSLAAIAMIASAETVSATGVEGLASQVAAVAPEYDYAAAPDGEASVASGEQTTLQISGSSILEEDDARSVTATLDAATQREGTDGSFETAEGDDFTVGTRAVIGGGQIVLSLAGAAAPERYDFTFDFVGVPVEDGKGGYYAELEDAGSVHIKAPWARDADGSAVGTHYSVSGNVLSQHIELSNDMSFPVTIDPAWSYDLEYTIGQTTAEKARDVLRKCFNCYFPVPGAPKAFPAPDQHLPLYINSSVRSPIQHNFWCIFDHQFYFKGAAPHGLWEFQFSTDEGHPDGLGSTITFTMYKKNGTGPNTLRVHAEIVNENPMGLSHALYTAGANTMWSRFASNLTNA